MRICLKLLFLIVFFIFVNLIIMNCLQQTGYMKNGGRLVDVVKPDKSNIIVGRFQPLTHYLSQQSKNTDFLVALFPPASNGDFHLEIRPDYSLAKILSKPLDKDRLIAQLKSKVLREDNNTKSILIYFFDKSFSDEHLLKSGCSVKNCRIKKRAEDFEMADVVIFKEAPKGLKRPLQKLDQIWIYYQLEAPVHTKAIPEGVVVNWTATYRLDSVLQTPYGKFKRKEKVEKIKRINYAKNKTKMVVWFVSNCRDDNGRMSFAKELQKFIPVDIYGDCGTLKCDRNNPERCRTMLKDEYRFYLAFENTNCREYITEKFFKCYRNDIIPIVMGAPIQDYQSMAPAHSFIHVDQFESPKHLARHLHLLSTHPSMYNRYFEWKSTYELIDTNFVCRLCTLLETSHYIKSSYQDLNKWWTDGQCLSMSGKQNWTKWK